MNLPRTINNASLLALASPDESHLVRVLIRNQTNHSDYVIRGKNRIARKYLAKYSNPHRCHVLEVPLSVWMNGIPTGAYRDNESVCHDVMGSRNTKLFPLVVVIVPFPGLESRREPIRLLPTETIPEPAEKPAGGTPASERMRAMRERKKQLAEEAAQLTPA